MIYDTLIFVGKIGRVTDDCRAPGRVRDLAKKCEVWYVDVYYNMDRIKDPNGGYHMGAKFRISKDKRYNSSREFFLVNNKGYERITNADIGRGASSGLKKCFKTHIRHFARPIDIDEDTKQQIYDIQPTREVMFHREDKE